MPHGAILWRSESDKQGYEEFDSACSAAASAALEAYLRRSPAVGDVPLSQPAATRPNASTRTWRPTTCAEPKRKPSSRSWTAASGTRIADCGRLSGSTCSDVDVARAGGWRTLAVMKQSYQLSDAADVLKVVENAPAGHTLDTPESQAQAAQSLT